MQKNIFVYLVVGDTISALTTTGQLNTNPKKAGRCRLFYGAFLITLHEESFEIPCMDTIY